MSNAPIHIYQQRVAGFKQERQTFAQRLTITSVLRLVLFVTAGWFVYRAFATKFAGYDLWISFVVFILFIVCVVAAANIKRRMQFLQQLIRINENELTVADGGTSFLDDGKRFEPRRGFAIDLNVFGKHALFHQLNRTGSQSGKQQLAARLNAPFTNRSSIENYQGCVQELAGFLPFRQTLLAQTLSLKEEDALASLQAGLDVQSFAVLKNRTWSLLATIWPLIGIGSIVYPIYRNNYVLLLLTCFIGLMITATVLSKLNLLYNHLSRRSYLFAQYARCFSLIAAQSFEHPYLREKKDEIKHASKAFERLSRLTGLFDLRLSVLTLFFNGLFLFDVHCARMYLRWNARYQNDIEKWFDTLGEIELLNSLASFHVNHPSFVFPSVNEDRLSIDAKAMAHPLMREGKAVTNDAHIGSPARLHLVTGSNMSGKSTYLRTIGLNIVLAQLGAPVFAQQFSFHPLRLLTSFHHIDSLEESTSYFYAELKSLKAIVDALDEPQPALVLLDEVMRGTNSKDKHDGSALLIRKLVGMHCLCLVATHDTELGVLASEYAGRIENYSFESTLHNNELHFDFKMRSGVAQAKNATFLMQQMGII